MQGDAAVDEDRSPGDVGAEALREYRKRHRGDIGRRAEAAERDGLLHAGQTLEALAGDRAGDDRVDADAVRTERTRELLDEHRLARFGRAVVRQVARRLRVQGSGDQHATADLVFRHVRGQALREDESCVEVNSQHLAPLPVGDVLNVLGFLAGGAGAVHEDRDPAELADRLVGKSFCILRFSKVGVRYVGAHYGGAFLLDRLRDGAADAAARARDERAVPLEKTAHERQSTRLTSLVPIHCPAPWPCPTASACCAPPRRRSSLAATARAWTTSRGAPRARSRRSTSTSRARTSSSRKWRATWPSASWSSWKAAIFAKACCALDWPTAAARSVHRASRRSARSSRKCRASAPSRAPCMRIPPARWCGAWPSSSVRSSSSP